MAKQQPAWVQNGTEPPPVTTGYWNYGQVWGTEDGPQRESLRHSWDTATWSWKHWGKKVRRDIEAVRAEGGRETLAARALDCVALAFVRLAHWAHRPKG